MYDGRADQVRIQFKENTETTYPLLLEASPIGPLYGLGRDFYMVIDHRGIVRYRTTDGVGLGSRFDGVSIRAAIVEALDELAQEQAASTSVVEEEAVPDAFGWIVNYPNPFNASTSVYFNIARAESVTLDIYDVRGRLVRRLWEGPLTAGEHQMRWDGRDDGGFAAATGVYLSWLQSAKETHVQKMLLLR